MEVKKRDTSCVYCGIKFDNSKRKTKASWEHIINDAKIVTIDNICLCCVSCNASKGAKDLADWINNSRYCKENNITRTTVSNIIKSAL